MTYWKFTKIQRIEEVSFNKVLESFYDNGIVGLVRENIQNSLDGKLKDINESVIVKIKTGKINDYEIPGLEDIKSRIRVLKGENEKTKETISHMQNSIDRKEIEFISFEDENTVGLSINENNKNGSIIDTYSAYAYSKGVHYVDENDEFEKSRGGSHGIGKIASNAASDLYLMFFANCDKFGNQHLGGTIQLIEHEYNEIRYRSTGYFTDEINEEFYPYENTFNDIFKKNTRGLKIIIPFFRSQFNKERDIIKSVCDNFFLAILNGKLIVEINEHIINKKTIIDFIKNEELYEQSIENIKKEFTPLYLDTYLNKEKLTLEIYDKKEKYEFDLHFNYDRSISKGRVAIIRTIGMKIEDKKIKGQVNSSYNAVMIPKTVKEDYFLKSLENESHSELSFEHFKDLDSQKNAKKFIRNLIKEMSSIIEDHIRKNNPVDGAIDTDDILYNIENKFRKDLSDSVSSVKINKGNKEKIIVKVKTPSRNKIKKGGSKKHRIQGIKKIKKEIDGRGKKEYFSINPDLVKRVVINNSETLNIDLSNEHNIDYTSACDMHFVVIDGMGKEIKNEFNLVENYKSVIDKSTEKLINIEENFLKGIKVKDKVIDIKLNLSSKFNKTLKFAYYLEV
jgi:hypothetical protein